MKPMLASDYDPAKLRFPCGVQPKIDGVRALSPGGNFTGRSLKKFGNIYTNNFFSLPEYADLDGELAANDEHHPDLCRLTTSATSEHNGTPFLLWHVFDCLAERVIGLPYVERYAELARVVGNMQLRGFAGHLRVVPMIICHNLAEVEAAHQKNLDDNYEGSIIRDLQGKHKQGRSTVREMGLLRIKDFLDFECVVKAISEGETNSNPAKINELGQTYRSTHQENMVPNGMVGNMTCDMLNDVMYDDKILFASGQEIVVGPGRMPHNKRLEFWEHPERLINDVIKGKLFPKGTKDKPRFATYQSHRSAADIS